MALKIRCPKCNLTQLFEQYGINFITEDAVLVCPSCGAEFKLTATVDRLPEEEPAAEEEKPEGEEEAPEEEEGGEEEAPEEEEGGAEEEEESAAPANLRVLLCSGCKHEWVGTYVTECPFCQGKAVLASTKTPTQRAEELVDDVQSGLLPASRALELFLGRPTKNKEVTVASTGA